MQGNLEDTEGKLKKSFLKLIKVEGNSGATQKIIINAYNIAGKLGGNSGETQKIIFKAYKSAGKLPALL